MRKTKINPKVGEIIRIEYDGATVIGKFIKFIDNGSCDDHVLINVIYSSHNRWINEEVSFYEKNIIGIVKNEDRQERLKECEFLKQELKEVLKKRNKLVSKIVELEVFKFI